jgi:hypothetical protein
VHKSDILLPEEIMSDTITEQQGKRIIELLEKIYKELERLNGQAGFLDRLPDIDASVKEVTATIIEHAGE